MSATSPADVARVTASAAAGDPDALLALATWRLYGEHLPRDLAEAHGLLRRAGDAGNAEAARIAATLVGNGSGCAADPARAEAMMARIAGADAFAAFQLKFLGEMRKLDAGRTATAEPLRGDPRIAAVRGLIHPAVCRYLMMRAEPWLAPSWVFHPETGERMLNPVRTSQGCSFGPVEEDLVVHAINRRIAEATGTEASRGEPLHMLRYAPGEQYRPHVDFLPGEPNQRVLTALLYLNDGYAGGETEFPRLGLRFRGDPGDLLIFANVGADGKGDPRTSHAGLPVTRGEKWLATRWIRARDYHPWAG